MNTSPLNKSLARAINLAIAMFFLYWIFQFAYAGFWCIVSSNVQERDAKEAQALRTQVNYDSCLKDNPLTGGFDYMCSKYNPRP